MAGPTTTQHGLYGASRACLCPWKRKGPPTGPRGQGTAPAREKRGDEGTHQHRWTPTSPSLLFSAVQLPTSSPRPAPSNTPLFTRFDFPFFATSSAASACFFSSSFPSFLPSSLASPPSAINRTPSRLLRVDEV